MNISPPTSAILLALALTQSGGCVYKRLWDTHQVLCNDDRLVTFSVLMDGSKEIAFHHTSLLAGDVEWLLGKPPSSVTRTEGLTVHRWSALNENQAGPDAIRVRVEMDFADDGGGQFLKRIRIPDRLAAVISEGMLEHSIRAACDIELNLWKKGVTFDLSEVQLADIPDQAGLRQALGEPQSSSTDTRLSYRFCLEPCSGASDASDRALVRMQYSEFGDPIGYYLKYLRYEATADLQKMEGRIRLLDL
jgi:hypothetical protein